MYMEGERSNAYCDMEIRNFYLSPMVYLTTSAVAYNVWRGAVGILMKIVLEMN
jgi:hypothetical protein